MKHLLPFVSRLFLVGLALLPLGCSQQAKLENHLAQGNASFDAGDYSTAEIEYKNALQIDSTIPEAIGNLGTIYYNQGRLREAYPFLARARDIAPDDLDYRGALGSLLLEAGDAQEAWDEAHFLLQADPNHPIAPFILQGASVRLQQMDEARATLETLQSGNENASILVSLGMLDAVAGDLDAAEAILRKASALDDTLSEAYTALGNVLWARNGAEAAEAAFKTAYERAGDNAAKAFRYIQFKARTGDQETTKSLMESLLETRPNFVPALMLKAQIAAQEQDLDLAIELSDKTLRLTPYSPEAILFSARLKIAKGEAEDAVKQLERLSELYPELAIAQYQLSLAHLANDQPLQSAASLVKTLAIDPNHKEAILMQAALNARQGNPQDAIISLSRLLEENPENLQAQSLLAQVHLEESNLDEALEIYQSLASQLPDNPQPPQMAGDVLLRLGKQAEARTSLEKSLKRNGEYLPAFERLTDLDIAEMNFDVALTRIDAQMENYPDSEILYFLQGKVLISQGQNESGESSLKKAIELKPTFRQAYLLLAGYYLSQNQLNPALLRLKALVDIYPEDVDALMQIGSIHEQQGDFVTAVNTFEQLIEIKPDHGQALNNLAYLKAENFNEIDQAYELAKKARDLLPGDAAVADTLGWIAYKRRDYELALGLVKESARQLGEHPMIQYHLGKAYAANGNKTEAADALNKALELGLDGDHAEDARTILED